MRIISGLAGGIPIQVPKSLLRPTADRTREAVFSMLGARVEDAAVLDLFAGSGSYGLECLSRGAKSCVFVESDRGGAVAIGETLRKARLSGGSCVSATVESWLKGRARASGSGSFSASASTTAYDLIFADPPFLKQRTDRDWDAFLLASPELRSLTAPDGLFVLESFAKTAVPLPADAPWILRDERRHGDVLLRFYSPGPAAPVSEPAADVDHAT